VTAALLVALGAAFGAPCRWLLDQVIQGRHDSVFPWGTLAINLLGSLGLGALLGAARYGMVGSAAVALVGTGFAGAFTTFSTFAYESVRLLDEGAGRYAVANVLLSLFLGCLLAAAGWVLAGLLWG